MTAPDGLPPELKELIDAERASPAPDAAARAVARARLANAVGSGAPGAAGSAFGAGKVLAILAVVVAASTFALLHDRGGSHARPAVPDHASRAPAPTPPPIATAPTAAPAPDTSHAEAGSAAKDTNNTKEKAPVGVPGDQSLRSSTAATRSTAQHAEATPSPPPTESADAATQAELIRRAWSALAVGEPDRALAIARDDERLHRDGALAEERDAVRIVALARLGRLDEARTAAAQFEHDYPSSLHHDLIERALVAGPDQDR